MEPVQGPGALLIAKGFLADHTVLILSLNYHVAIREDRKCHLQG